MMRGGFEALGELAQRESLVCERTPQPLDEDVVQAPATTVHRDPDVGLLLPGAVERILQEPRINAPHISTRVSARASPLDVSENEERPIDSNPHCRRTRSAG